MGEIFLFWCLLLFGGSIVPSATGLMISSVPQDLRQLASGIGQGVYNLLGYALGTLLPGVLMDHFGSRWGMRALLCWSVLGVFGLAFAMCLGGRGRYRGVPVASEVSTTVSESSAGVPLSTERDSHP